jgi:predicted RNA binding protein with dsRBD fold (UPF0201 family)
MMKCALVLGLNPNNINDNKEHNISEKSTDDVFEKSSDSDPFIEPYVDLPEIVEEERDNDDNQQLESSITNTPRTIATYIAKQFDFPSISNFFIEVEEKLKEIEIKINFKAKSISELQRRIHQLLPSAVSANAVQEPPSDLPSPPSTFHRSSGTLP